MDVTSSNQTIFGHGIYLMFYMHFFYFIFRLFRMNWSYAFIYFSLCCTFKLTFGFDPVWGENFPLYKMQEHIFSTGYIPFVPSGLHILIFKEEERKREDSSLSELKRR